MASPSAEVLKLMSKGISQKLEEKGEATLAAYVRRLARAAKKDPPSGSVDETITNANAPSNGRYSYENLENLVATYPESVTARGLLESKLYVVAGDHAFFFREDPQGAAIAWAEGIRRHFCVANVNLDLLPVIKSEMKNLYSDGARSPEVRAAALIVDAHWAPHQQIGDFKPILTKLKMAQHLLPEDPFVPALLGDVLGTLHRNGEAIAAYKQATDIGIQDPARTFFFPAVLLSVGGYTEESIGMLEEFVGLAEPDDRKLPAAYYRLALAYGLRGPNQLGKAKRYHLLAKKADAARLPVWKDEAEGLRAQADALLKKFIACGNEKCSAVALHPCSRCNQSYYCSQECLNADWPFHKKMCKILRKKHQKKEGGRKKS